ncbi:uncharacterized protein HKW66_Vig0241540 [Vigna angularis]|uniref:50S ribosomal protein L33, chloroplastic n=2 Tax=Phaseolus angularis TaxID=3914 RepID=A0A8T0JKR5_PHAAN|nr:uncharacterized protein HKW66_Vig0241540 [Vigna angularis]
MGDKKKKAQMFVKPVSAAGTGFFYEKRKPRQFTEKLEFRKFDPRVNRHVLFTEAKMKNSEKHGEVRLSEKSEEGEGRVDAGKSSSYGDRHRRWLSYLDGAWSRNGRLTGDLEGSRRLWTLV